MDQKTETPGGEALASDQPVLYKCPYCVAGRFKEKDGWAKAVAHVRTHQKRERSRVVGNRDSGHGGAGDRGILFDEAC